MFQTLPRRALLAAAAVLFAAGCSGGLTSGGSSSLTPAAHVGQAVRILPGPVVAGPIVIPLVSPKANAPIGYPKRKKKETLFVADCDSGVLLYDPKKANSSPIGSITDGVNCAFGVAVDKAGFTLPTSATTR